MGYTDNDKNQKNSLEVSIIVFLDCEIFSPATTKVFYRFQNLFAHLCFSEFYQVVWMSIYRKEELNFLDFFYRDIWILTRILQACLAHFHTGRGVIWPAFLCAKVIYTL